MNNHQGSANFSHFLDTFPPNEQVPALTCNKRQNWWRVGWVQRTALSERLVWASSEPTTAVAARSPSQANSCTGSCDGPTPCWPRQGALQSRWRLYLKGQQRTQRIMDGRRRASALIKKKSSLRIKWAYGFMGTSRMQCIVGNQNLSEQLLSIILREHLTLG